MSKKRNPQYAVKHESWSSNVHKSLKHYDRQRDKQVDLEEYDGLVWDNVNNRHALLDTVIVRIVDSELEDNVELTYDEMEEIVLSDIDYYLEAHGYGGLD